MHVVGSAAQSNKNIGSPSIKMLQTFMIRVEYILMYYYLDKTLSFLKERC